MASLENGRPPEEAPPRPAGGPVDRDALWYDCETEGREEGRGLAVAVGASALTLAVIGIAAWYLA